MTSPQSPSPIAAAQQQRLLKDILDGLDDAVLVFDRSLRIEFANRRCLEFFPFHQEPHGRLLIEIVRHDSVVRLARTCIESARPVKEELILPGTKRRVFIVSAAPLSEAQNQFRLIIRDETIRFETEQVRKDFVANASHELRTPLTIINGYIENLLDGDTLREDPDTAVRFLETMKKHGDRIASIIEDMLTISKLESSTTALQRRPFPLRACVQDVIDRLSPKIPEDRVHISLRIPDGATLNGDRFYWDQIFFNLLENAAKYNPSGPLRVTIVLRREEDADCIEFSDDGIGISTKDLPYVFTRFYRSENQLQNDVKGTGLGLSIVKRAVEAHHGEIRLESIPGVRTTFTIRLPRE